MPQEYLRTYNPTIRKMVRGITKTAGVAAETEVVHQDGSRLPFYDVNRFRPGSAKIVGVLRYYPLGLDNPDQVKIDFAESAHVYNVRRGKYLGQTDARQVRLARGEAAVFALLPYRIQGVEVSVKKVAGSANTMHYSAEVTPRRADQPHVLRVELTQPEGRKVDYGCDNVLAEDGQYSGTCFLGENAEEGKWKLHVEDIVTGHTATTKFTVEQ